jgi:putative ABC transport system permease protein
MNATVSVISWTDLGIMVIPIAAVVAIMFAWNLRPWFALYSNARMLLQLTLIGYFLVFIFEADEAWFIVLVLTSMLLVASWISLNPIVGDRWRLYPIVLVSLTLGGGMMLFLVTQEVLHVDPWYSPRETVPLAGMIFANSMTTVCLAAERYEAELKNGVAVPEARRIAFQTGMIPVINSMLAVGLVALPGMMTGQILSGVSPLIATRYQIVVMSMLFGASGLCAACYLQLVSVLGISAGARIRVVDS